jgi:hypothetical protein
VVDIAKLPTKTEARLRKWRIIWAGSPRVPEETSAPMKLLSADEGYAKFSLGDGRVRLIPTRQLRDIYQVDEG